MESHRVSGSDNNGTDRRSTPSESSSHALWVVVALIFAGGLVLRSYAFTEPWLGGHSAWGGAFYGNVARNFVRYGFWTTRFAPIVSSGIVDPSQFEVYYHHPPLSMWLTAVSFRIFGVHEWSARLMPLIFSLLLMGLVFQYARSAFGNTIAVYALLFMAVLPVDAYYASHLDPNSSISIFFTALTVEGYRRWLNSGRTPDALLSAVSVVLGCLSGWYTYLVIPPILAHFWFVHRSTRPRNVWTPIWLLPAAAIVVFGFFLLHRQFAFASGRPEAYQWLGERVLKRTLNYEFEPSLIVATYLWHILKLYTIPVVAMMAAWLVLFIRDLRRNQLGTGDWGIALLLSYGLLYAIAFPGHLPNHDFFVRAYAPGVALACAVTVARAAGAVSRPGLRLIVGLLVGGASLLAIATTHRFNAATDHTEAAVLQGFGSAVAAVSTERDPVLMPIGVDRILQYYVDRPITFDLDTPDKVQSAASATRGPYLIVVPERSSARFRPLLAYLEGRYPQRRANGLLIFRGNGA